MESGLEVHNFGPWLFQERCQGLNWRCPEQADPLNYPVPISWKLKKEERRICCKIVSPRNVEDTLTKPNPQNHPNMIWTDATASTLMWEEKSQEA